MGILSRERQGFYRGKKRYKPVCSYGMTIELSRKKMRLTEQKFPVLQNILLREMGEDGGLILVFF